MRRARSRLRAGFWLLCTAVALGGPRAGPAPLAAQSTDAGRGGKVVVLARHAEKEDGSDPVLSEAGLARARALAHVLSRLPVDAIYTSQFVRTRMTAQPLAEATGVVPEVVDAGDVPGLVERITSGAARTVVVIGHSNTVPAIARALGVPDVPPIPERQYDDLLVVRLSEDGSATLLPLRYGAPTP
jgi:phosphohistidine phosphatase SixA